MRTGDIFVVLVAIVYAALLCALEGSCPLFIQMTLLSCSGDLIKDLCQTAINQNHAPHPDD